MAETETVNGVKENKLWKGVFAVSGIMSTLVIYGVLQEKIMRVPYGLNKEFFKYSLFLVFCNRLTTSAVSAGALLASKKVLDPVAPVYKYCLISVTNILTTTCQYEALKYVSFPVQTLAKCAKMIPVMVWGTLIMQKKYKGFDYLVAFLVTLGCSVFILFPAGDDISPYNKGRENTVWGVSLMAGYLGFDGFTSTFQDKLFKGYNMEIHNQIFYTTLCSCVLSFTGLVLQGHLLLAVDFVSRHRDCLLDIALLSTESLLPFDVLLTTYDIALVDQDFLSQIPWQYAVIDEAQRLKNPNSVLYNVLLEQFLIPRRLLITGTPIQNNLTELWALMHFCMPLVFGTLDQFLSAFKESGESLPGLDASNVKETYKSLKFILGAFMLRRTKSLLIESGNLVLPPLTELTVMVPLVSLQKKIYTSILRKELPGLLALSSGASTHTSLQNIVIQLRKACSHPYLFPGIEPEPFEEGEHLVQASGKLLVLDQLLKRLHDIGHRVLLFSQMTSTLDILQDFMELRKYSYERLDGSVRAEERFAAIKSFSAKTERGLDSEADASNAFVFMISTRAGGVGLNLVAADTVIFYEQDWNPQVDKQALQRAHRIGQISHVLSINLVSEHTVEEVILRRAERKLQLSLNVVGDTTEDKEEDRGDLRSLVFGLQRFDPEEETYDEESDNQKMVELSSLAEKVVAIRQNVEPDKEARKLEINTSDTLERDSSSAASVYSELDEASYLAWVEKLKEASRSSKDEKVMELGDRNNVTEERHVRVEAARKKAEEKKLATWEAHGYESLSVEEPIFPDDVDSNSDAGSVQFVFGDCTNPSTVSQEPAIIFSCVDDSGTWGRGGMFNALSKLSSTVPDAYHRASEFKDLHLGDVHLIKIDDNDEQQNTEESKPLWVALAVTQSYRPKRKVPRSSISIPDLERCLAKASFSASQKSASLHMPRIGYQDGSDRSQWYTVERLLRKYSSIFAVKIFVYYYRRSP